MILSGAVTRLLTMIYRKCPSCGGRQKTQFTKRDQPVTCKSCGRTIPPGHIVHSEHHD
ncbi:MAG: hypothetical protein ABI811_00805 [Acidobacteriota bacterium]